MPRTPIVLVCWLTSCAGLGEHVVTSVSPNHATSRSWEDVFAHPTALTVDKRVSGWVRASASILIDASNPRTPAELKADQWVPVPFYLVHHPAHGVVLFDTGVAEGDCSYGFRPFYWVPCQVGPEGAAARQLGDQALTAIVLSHGHGDHAQGLAGLTARARVPVIVAESEWSAVNGAFRAFEGYLTEQLAGDYPVQLLRTSDFTEMPLLGRVFDLYGDGSIWLIESSGHTRGQLSALFNAEAGPILLTFDASHLEANFKFGIAPGFTADKEAALATLARLAAFKAAYPQVQVVYGHEPSQWPLRP
jgi:N-acyl homoserine lactone hydrolase